MKGEPFCQYVIGNIYFQRDFMRIDGKTRDSFTEEAEFNRYMSENIAKCESWFWKAFRGGMLFAGNNLNQYYTKGDIPYVIPEPEKAGQYAEALRWYKAAASGKEPGAWRQVGKFYEKGIGVTKDIHYAIECYKAGERERNQLLQTVGRFARQRLINSTSMKVGNVIEQSGHLFPEKVL